MSPTSGKTSRVYAGSAAIGAVEVELDDRGGWLLPDDLDPSGDLGDWAALLPALYPTVRGWSDRSWLLSPHAKALVGVHGNDGPPL